MHWLYLLLAFGAIVMAFSAAQVWWLALCLLAAFALMLAWARGWYLSRIGGNGAAPTHDMYAMIDPSELRRLRAQAEARRAAAPAEGDDAP